MGKTTILGPLAAPLAALLPAAAAAQDCARLAALDGSRIQVVEATQVPAGALELPFPPGSMPLAAHCRLSMVARPSAQSQIGIEVWLPAAGQWNGKLLGTANGGFSGAIPRPAMAAGLARGYAVVGTDTGHQGDQMEFGRGSPERIRDWAYRAVHEMTVAAKRAVAEHYGQAPARSYFEGCSTGGQQALSEIQRYPDDYDGVVAGAPGHNRIRLIYGFLWSWMALHDEAGAPLLPASKLEAITRAAMTACDADDGVRDGLIQDPRRCGFDPARMQCAAEDGPDCLTAPQVEAVRKVYAGAHNPRTGARIFPGWMRGSEAGWGAYLLQPPEPPRLGLFRDFAFDDPDWDWRGFDWDHDIERIDAILPYLDATATDLSGFRNRGGKLLMYAGWADPVVPAQDTVDYFERLLAANGAETTAGFARLFVVPGMEHCGFGRTITRVDALAALEDWVERGIAPAQLQVEDVIPGQAPRRRTVCAEYPAAGGGAGSGCAAAVSVR